MAATTGFQAGPATNDMVLSYGIEAVWGTAPAIQFQGIRLMSETLTSTKTRQRPSELFTTREAPPAVTTQIAAAGAINYALSYGSYDDLMQLTLGNEWQAAQAIAGIAGDITITNLTSTTATLSSTLSTKYANVTNGSWIRLLGFTNAGNNGFWYVTAKGSNQSISLKGTQVSVTETPAGTAAQVRASTILNGTEFQSLFMQKKLATSQYLTYPGSMISGMTLSGQIGQFFQGAFSVMSKNEVKATTDSSTGAVLAATTGRVHDPITGFGGLLRNETATGISIDQLALNIVNTGAAAQFAMGSTNAAGMLQGYLEVSGTFRAYFANFNMYDEFVAETSGRLEFITKDNLGNAYIITLLAATYNDVNINAGGPNQSVYASFQFQADPQSGGGTIRIDRLPAT